jgi:hypothetical protein
MRKGGVATTVLASTVLAAMALAVTALGACGNAGGNRQDSIATSNPARTLAPLVRLAKGESTFPVSALLILNNSGLEWAGGPCGYERDITPSAERARGEPSPLPELVPARLGREPKTYRVRPQYDGCERSRPEVFTTAQRTRPFDVADRPAGLHIDEGFYLDLKLDHARGRRRVGLDGTFTGAPMYYAVDRATLDGQSGVRISYWVLFGVEMRIDRYGETLREGDWERVDILAQHGPGKRRYTPYAVEYRIGERIERVAWEEVELAQGAHPVVYLDQGLHTPRPVGQCDGCIEWRTWRLLRDVRAEPWWGYGGGWGEIGRDDESSGPSGPSPFEVGGASPSPINPPTGSILRRPGVRSSLGAPKGGLRSK